MTTYPDLLCPLVGANRNRAEVFQDRLMKPSVLAAAISGAMLPMLAQRRRQINFEAFIMPAKQGS
ncbi:hypothetical protein [Roseinatronobacter sp. S2]|uniref:hypothetical protein n=1 Tax=Roseinatronobacter sp. S2 TaxID=3035471 RepID=UPI00240F54D2|nr:hypothetical protein [Roseinatronobacter sp. S2]WFE75196.1 hypothetical protein P8S53_01965 [Roseinatronobacter sp. S2]